MVRKEGIRCGARCRPGGGRPGGGRAVLVGVDDDEGELVRELDRGRDGGKQQREHLGLELASGLGQG